MKHLFIIQCHQYEPAVKLGELIKSINPDFGIFYAWDWLNFNEGNKFMKLDPSISHPFKIGYFTLDQGLFHLNLWKYLRSSDLFVEYDYFHVVSQNDLPCVGILNIDNLAGTSGYGMWTKVGNVHLFTAKSPTWYGLSKESVKCVNLHYHRWLAHIIEDIYPIHEDYPKEFTGGIDEYVVGYMLDQVNNEFVGKLDKNLHRFIGYTKNKKHTCDKLKISDFGHYTSKRSPMTLDKLPAVESVIMEYSDTYFARKFDFNSDAYNYYYQLALNKFKYDE